MIVAVHQPDLLPYTGFWYKMTHSDVFVLLPYDQFQKRGYQRRVTMRGSWCSHHLVGNPHRVPINGVVVARDWQHRLIDEIRGRYSGARYWRQRGPDLLDAIASLPPHQRLDEVNESLIHLARDLLGITTPVVRSDPGNQERGAARVLQHVLDVGGTTYLAGQGGRAYMASADDAFAAKGVEIQWSEHAPRSGDSVLTAYFDESDPMEVVVAT